MECEVRHDKKTVIYWVSQQESKNHRLRYRIEQETAEFRQQKYRVVVFQSGTEDLYSNTKALIQHNRRQQSQQSQNPVAR